VGTPAASDLTLAPGAGHGDESNASFQGSAQEQIEALPASPKPANLQADSSGSVIELTARTMKPEVVETVARETTSLVMTRPKPEKRKNAKERAREKYTKDRTTPDMTAKAKFKVETKSKGK
jgi:hypothetical protein